MERNNRKSGQELVKQRWEEQSWFLEKISKIDKPLAKLANRKSRSELIKSEMKRVITKDTKENQD